MDARDSIDLAFASIMHDVEHYNDKYVVSEALYEHQTFSQRTLPPSSAAAEVGEVGLRPHFFLKINPRTKCKSAGKNHDKTIFN